MDQQHPEKEGQTEEGATSREVGAFPRRTCLAAPLWRFLGKGELVIIPLADVSPLTDSAAAAAKSHQSCPTLRHPIDVSPPGSSGILPMRGGEMLT